MKKTYWLYLIAAIITIVGLVTGKFLFLLFVLPLGLFGSNKNQ
ncbi:MULTISPECIES: hypothetical protein [Mesonia]|uniref:Uncharacterized protein n=1 Tax=Mesonia oceanica TaxID=2687242 RepID=A0AC61YB06_9FLAO|nr:MULTISPECIES: hypothetical protein [Mesonia]VVV01669.1 hypothetical protein FVB9532_02962 [Mesonia oceanica]|tara:strand:+ start:15415 stop:15543 length:129 start_codon:yes stop_codon:yes gene_type:complete